MSCIHLFLLACKNTVCLVFVNMFFTEKYFYDLFTVTIFLFLPTFQDGVNWLAFLNKYKLHGILCDDMGLGKTLQSICILAGDHCHR